MILIPWQKSIFDWTARPWGVSSQAKAKGGEL